MNNNLNFKFNSLQWEYKNTHLVMPARRVFGGLVRHFSGGSGPIQKNI
jgi:hypothetical protein